jgi:hypothetical protein
VRCMHCHADNPVGLAVCASCGQPLETAAPVPAAGDASLPRMAIPLPAFRSASSLAKATSVLFAVYIIVTIAAVAAGYGSIRYLVAGGHVEDEMNDSELAGACLSLVWLPVQAALIIVFLIWMHRAARNLPALGLAHPRSSPGWAVGWWFIPFANVIKPYQVMTEIWTASEPPPGVPGADSRDVRRPASLLAFWWWLWLIANFVGNVAARVMFRTDTVDAQINVRWLLIASDILDIAAALLAIMVVQSVEARQQCRFAALLAEPAPAEV